MISVLLAPEPDDLSFNDAEFALKLLVWTVDGLWRPVGRLFADG